MEPTVVLQQDVTRGERNPSTELFTALVMPALNAVANSVVGSQVVAGLGFDSLVVGAEAKEAAASFLHVQQQNEAFGTLSFDYIKAASTTDSLQLAA